MLNRRAAQTKTPEANQRGSISISRRPLSSTSASGHPLLHLQQTIGNRAVGHFLQAKLQVNQPGDEYEQEADRVAEQVMRMPEPLSLSHHSQTGIQRKCAECASGKGLCPKCAEEEEKIVQRKPLTTRITRFVQRQVMGAPEKQEETLQAKEASGGTPAVSPSVESHVNSLQGGGQPLSPFVRAFFEPRFGYDFSQVRVHADGRAEESARALDAQAYTVGHDVVFRAGQYGPVTTRGMNLLAHELTHVVQQNKNNDRMASCWKPSINSSSGCLVQRKIEVQDPKKNIPNPGGKGKVQTNAQTVEDYAKSLCSEGKASVKVDAASGALSLNKAFCAVPTLPPGVYGPPELSEAERSKHRTGCGCLCDLAESKHMWKVKIDDANWPGTVFDDEDAANGKKPGGSGGIVTAPSPNSSKLWGAATVTGKEVDIDPWLVLGHELCGHGWLGTFGLHGPDVALPRGEGRQEKTVERENLLRAEHGIELRGTFKDPNCGESYWRDKTAPGKVNWSSFRAVCQTWRDAYNKKHGTKFKITDRIP